MARYATPEEEYQCPRCDRFVVFDHLKRYHTTIICPHCYGSMGSFGVRITQNVYTIGFIDSPGNNPPQQHDWGQEAIKNLEEINPMQYLEGIEHRIREW